MKVNDKKITVTVDYEALLSARVALELIATDETYTLTEEDRDQLLARKAHLDSVANDAILRDI